MLEVFTLKQHRTQMFTCMYYNSFSSFADSDGLLYLSFLLPFHVSVFNSQPRFITRNTICQCVKIKARGYLTVYCLGFNDILVKLEKET